MSRPLDPEHADSLTLTLRITRPLADALDAELARFTEATPGVSASRATIARIALMRVFLSTGARASSPEAPAAAATPGTPPPEAPAVTARAALAPRAPTVDPRQLAIPDAANDTPVGAGSAAHTALYDRYTEARERHRFTHDDATRALVAAGVPVENLRRELVKPTAQWTPAHASALGAWLDTLGDGALSEPSPAKAPSRTRAHAEASPENDALRARYRAALDAKRLTNEPTAKLVGCSEATLRQWKNGVVKNLGGDKDPEGKWRANLAGILDALPHPLE